MDATLYTGNGSTQTITNAAGFQPDFIWLKSRSGAGNSSLTDSVRGVNSQLFSNLTNAEGTQIDQVTAFNSNVFSLGANVAGTGSTNVNAVTYVGWQWQAGQGSTSSNTDGTITSQVSANTSAGFSVATYTGTGANATVGHGLGVAPKMIIGKSRSGSTGWLVYHQSLGNTNFLILNATDASAAAAAAWNNTSPTSSVFTIGTGNFLNTNGATQVAYCWSEIDGFSKFDSYTGNGSADGTFVYTGFRPAFVMIKRTNSTGNWIIKDYQRASNFNPQNGNLYPNLSFAEDTTSSVDIDFLANGFKLRGTISDTNASGSTYVYAAYASNPFKNSLAR
jgi:hypothetical protein